MNPTPLKKRVEAQSAVQTLLGSFRIKGLSPEAIECRYFAAAVGDDEWIGNPENRSRIAAGFTALKNKDQAAYSRLRGLYCARFEEFYGRRRPESVLIPRNHPAFP